MFGAKLFTFLILNAVMIYGAVCIAKEIFGHVSKKYAKYAFIAKLLTVVAAQFGVYFCFGGRM